jgi:hypothetical protein
LMTWRVRNERSSWRVTCVSRAGVDTRTECARHLRERAGGHAPWLWARECCRTGRRASAA